MGNSSVAVNSSVTENRGVVLGTVACCWEQQSDDGNSKLTYDQQSQVSKIKTKYYNELYNNIMSDT